MKLKMLEKGQKIALKKEGYKGYSLKWNPEKKDYDIILCNHVVVDEKIAIDYGASDLAIKVAESQGYKVVKQRPKFPYALVEYKSEEYQKLRPMLEKNRKAYLKAKR